MVSVDTGTLLHFVPGLKCGIGVSGIEVQFQVSYKHLLVDFIIEPLIKTKNSE